MGPSRRERDERRRFNEYIRHERKRLQSVRDAEVTAAYGDGAHKMCGSKTAYPSELAAMEYAAKETAEYGIMHHVYKCPYCGLYHLTTKEQSR